MKYALYLLDTEGARPMLLAVYDLENDGKTNQLIAGHTLLIAGKRLKVDREDSAPIW